MSWYKTIGRVLLWLMLPVALLGQHSDGGINTEITFSQSSWDEVLTTARKEGKLIFVDVYTTWCGPCKMMDKQVFTDAEIAAVYNQHFISFKVDAEEKRFEQFMSLRNVEEFPSFFYFSSQGELLKKYTGAMNTEKFLQLGLEIIEQQQLFTLVDNQADLQRLQELRNLYKNSTKPPKLLKEYAYLLKKYHKPYNTVVNEYLLSQEMRMKTPPNRDFVYDFMVSLENNTIDYFIDDLAYYQNRFGSKIVNEKVKLAIYNSILTAIEDRDELLFIKALENIEKANLQNKDRFYFEMQNLYYQGIEDWKNYAKVAQKYMKRKKVSDPKLLNEVAKNFYQNLDNPSQLELALKWAKQSVKIENEYYNNETQAILLYKLGKTNQALKVATDAIRIAQRRSITYKSMMFLIDRIQSQAG